MKTAIATDTNGSIAPGRAGEEGLYILPMPVIIEEQTFSEGVDVDHARLYEAMKQHCRISTSQPAPGQVTEFWDAIFRDGYDEIVYIPMSSGLSGACGNAVLLAQDYSGRVQVADNHRISVPLAISVDDALRMARRGCGAEEICARLEERAYDTSIYITVDSMEYLKKGGRITMAAAAFATVLNLKPILTIQGDKLDLYGKIRGMKHAEAKMIEAVKNDRVTRFGRIPDSEIRIDTAGTFEDPAKAELWRRTVQEAFPDNPVAYVDLPCSIACHVGMNAAGVAVTRIDV